MNTFTRREFLATSTVAALLPVTAKAAAATHGKLCFFSKHLPELNWQQLGQTVKQLGFDGVDLTVRPGGHVLPERAAEDLPKAVTALRAAGLEVPMITTGLLNATEPTAQPIVATAGKLGVGYFKTGYHKYKFVDPRAELQQAGQAFRSLAELGKQHNMQAGFHNHASYIGGGIWDFLPQMDALVPQWGGWYFDARHATAEGGAGAWKAALQTIAPRLRMTAIKDFVWKKSAKGWVPEDCPLGQGMVDWDAVFAIYAKSGFSGPISLHIEYEIHGKTAQEKQENLLAAAARDFAFLKAKLQTAYAKS